MKFKKVKAGEVAPKIQNRVPFQYVVEMRKVIVGFMIKLEEDTASGKISRSSSSGMLYFLRSQLFIADAYAKMAKDAVCFAGGWESKINSAGTCIIPAPVNSPDCGANKLKCDPTIFGTPTCVDKTGTRGQGFTARCENAVKNDNTKLAQIHANLTLNSADLEALSSKVNKFCDDWKAANNSRDYDGCANLKTQVARIQSIRTLPPQATEVPEITVGGIQPIELEETALIPEIPQIAEQPIATVNPVVEPQVQQQVQQQVQTGTPAAAGTAGDLRIRNGGSPQPSENESNNFCKPQLQIFPEAQSCVTLLNTFNESAHVRVNRHPSELGAEGPGQTETQYVAFKPISASEP
ncbi:MAG: hypothetical protein LW878_00045, partial [Proteobacteria bacterium]|nr:hypothetical protein [Pseudomonadota bacterium]